MLLIGSEALNQYLPDGDKLVCNDLDFIATWGEIKQDNEKRDKELGEAMVSMVSPTHVVRLPNDNTQPIVEYEIAMPGSTGAALLKILSNYSTTPIEWLYALKMSHRYLKNSPSFKKTMDHILLMRRIFNGISIPDREWFKWREKVTYDYARPRLKGETTKDEFFRPEDDFYVYDHDAIHETVAVFGKPAYRSYMKDGAEVACDKQKFFDLEDDMRLAGVYEESCVLALERSLIPHPGGMTPTEAFEYALMKVCTSITSGWFREFAWENYHSVIDFYNARKDKYFHAFLESKDKLPLFAR